MKLTRHHTIISGTGRAGTTFLVELLTNLGLDTGFDPDNLAIDPRAHAGLEYDLRKPNTPYFVKSPWLCDWLPAILEDENVVVDHAIIPVRNFVAAANSRARVTALAHAEESSQVAGGLWSTNDPAEQVTVLFQKFSKLMETLARHDIPVTLMWFPRLTQDEAYIFEKLSFLMPGISFGKFAAAFATTVKTHIVHRLTEADV